MTIIIDCIIARRLRALIYYAPISAIAARFTETTDISLHFALPNILISLYTSTQDIYDEYERDADDARPLTLDAAPPLYVSASHNMPHSKFTKSSWLTVTCLASSFSLLPHIVSLYKSPGATALPTTLDDFYPDFIACSADTLPTQVY